MPFVHQIRTRVRGRRASARFWVERGGDHPIPRVHQEDSHSCGFLAALTVAQYFHPSLTVRDVLNAIPLGWQPSPMWGLSPHKLTRTLTGLGVNCEDKEGLGWGRLLRSTREGHPVIVTVQPEWYECDHWTVISDMNEIMLRRITLSNYDRQPDGYLSWHGFKKIWSPRGAAIVCKKT